jgi:hypothetical protein
MVQLVGLAVEAVAVLLAELVEQFLLLVKVMLAVMAIMHSEAVAVAVLELQEVMQTIMAVLVVMAYQLILLGD